MERLNQAMRSALTDAAPFLWIATFAGSFTSDHVHIVVPLGLMAGAGTVLGQMRERDGTTIARLGKELADATRPGHHGHRHLRGVPGGQ